MNNTLIKDHCRRTKHSREADGLADLVLGNVLLQIADVSASSTSCCQWLDQSIPNKTTRLGLAAAMRGTLYGGRHSTLSKSGAMTPASSEQRREQSPLKSCMTTSNACLFYVCMYTEKTHSQLFQCIGTVFVLMYFHL